MAIGNRVSRALRTFLQFPLTRIVLFSVVLLAAIVLAQSPRAVGVTPHSAAGATFSLLVAALSVLAYCGCVRLIERRAATEFAFIRALPDFVLGAVIGASLFAGTMLLLVLCGVASTSATGDWSALAYALAASLVAAVMEETLLRGVLFRIVEESLGSWIALALSALVFGGLHAFNQGATLRSSAAIALEAGVLLAAVYMYTRSLWMPIGLHLGWNFTEGGIFGASVSGGKARGLLETRMHGPEWLSGGAFGPEASLVAVLVCLAAGIVFLRLAVRRGRVVAPFWSRRRAGAAGAST